jgi:hypothetical protein
MIIQKVSHKIIFCWLEEFWNSIQHQTSISGHTFRDFGYRRTKYKTIIYSKCERCGLVDITWYQGNVFDQMIKGLKRV